MTILWSSACLAASLAHSIVIRCPSTSTATKTTTSSSTTTTTTTDTRPEGGLTSVGHLGLETRANSCVIIFLFSPQSQSLA